MGSLLLGIEVRTPWILGSHGQGFDFCFTLKEPLRRSRTLNPHPTLNPYPQTAITRQHPPPESGLHGPQHAEDVTQAPHAPPAPAPTPMPPPAVRAAAAAMVRQGIAETPGAFFVQTHRVYPPHQLHMQV